MTNLDHTEISMSIPKSDFFSSLLAGCNPVAFGQVVRLHRIPRMTRIAIMKRKLTPVRDGPKEERDVSNNGDAAAL